MAAMGKGKAIVKEGESSGAKVEVGLLDKLRKLDLTREERLTDVMFDPGDGGEGKAKAWQVVGKVLTSRFVSAPSIRDALSVAWNLFQDLKVSTLGRNRFQMTFPSEKEMGRILRGGPWKINGNAILFQIFDEGKKLDELRFEKMGIWIRIHNLPLGMATGEWGEKDGRQVGEVMEADVDEEGRGWGDYLRIRVEVDVREPLGRAVFYTIEGSGRREMAPVTYERLPNICKACGRVGHSDKECGIKIKEGGDFPYGTWMRAVKDSRPRRRGRSGTGSSGSMLTLGSSSEGSAGDWSAGKNSSNVKHNQKKEGLGTGVSVEVTSPAKVGKDTGGGDNALGGQVGEKEQCHAKGDTGDMPLQKVEVTEKREGEEEVRRKLDLNSALREEGGEVKQIVEEKKMEERGSEQGKQKAKEESLFIVQQRKARTRNYCRRGKLVRRRIWRGRRRGRVEER